MDNPAIPPPPEALAPSNPPDSVGLVATRLLTLGPGKVIDTTRWFVISSNFLGSCYGTTGPTSTDPATGRAWGISFPV